MPLFNFDLNMSFPIFCSITFVAFARFCLNFHHTLTIKHCMLYRKKEAEGPILQELCHFVIIRNYFLDFAL